MASAVCRYMFRLYEHVFPTYRKIFMPAPSSSTIFLPRIYWPKIKVIRFKLETSTCTISDFLDRQRIGLVSATETGIL